MADSSTLLAQIQERFGNHIQSAVIAQDELTIEVPAGSLIEICTALRDEEPFQFSQLIDLCGVDYAHYGYSEWETDSATSTGFERGVNVEQLKTTVQWTKPRFAVVLHLLSLTHNQRLRLRVFPEGEPPLIDSLTEVWEAANWFEREAFDLFGILFRNHPDLRRILTDYGFIGHPFRKDFPLIGNVEVRYDAAQQRVIYEPVSIEPRTLVPKVVREGRTHNG